MSAGIHRVGVEAAGLVAALQAASGVEPAWSAESVATILAGPGCLALVLQPAEAPDPAGFALLRVLPPEAELLSIGVVPERRGRGLGRALLDAVAAAAAAAGAAVLHLEVAEDNAAARRLYDGAGFVQAGRRAAYYASAAGPRRDALLLSLTLTRR